MAINIFQGGSKKASVNTASASQRAQQAKSSLTGASEASSSGNTAVKTGGILGKVGNFVGKAAGVASKFLPGTAGTIARGLKNLFNDPEWWQTVPGHAVTVNAPLKTNQTGTLSILVSDVDLDFKLSPFRNVIVESCKADNYVMQVTDQMVTQYLMPEIRKVVNAVPLQNAQAYKEVLEANASMYALWRQLMRTDYMLKHGQTYIPNMNVSRFPCYQVTNAAWLQSTISRIEEYLRASVRLPHTLCEYLAWRYGRVYHTSDSAKSALSLHSVLPISTAIDEFDSYISQLMNVISADTEHQVANTDLYNAYYDHDLMVTIADDTQFKYDAKEFMLRTNMDLIHTDPRFNESLNPVYMDSSLDNPTTFMASTVSTRGRDYDNNESILFPVLKLTIYGKVDPMIQPQTGDRSLKVPVISTASSSVGTYAPYLNLDEDYWYAKTIAEPKVLVVGNMSAGTATMSDPATILMDAALLKSVDTYNKDLYITSVISRGTTTRTTDAAFNSPTVNNRWCYDLTSLSYDMGLVADSVIGNEHVFAFANLVAISRKTSMSYAKGEKLVARDTAELIDTLDVAAVTAPTK